MGSDGFTCKMLVLLHSFVVCSDCSSLLAHNTRPNIWSNDEHFLLLLISCNWIWILKDVEFILVWVFQFFCIKWLWRSKNIQATLKAPRRLPHSAINPSLHWCWVPLIDVCDNRSLHQATLQFTNVKRFSRIRIVILTLKIRCAFHVNKKLPLHLLSLSIIYIGISSSASTYESPTEIGHFTEC